jgi:transposase
MTKAPTSPTRVRRADRQARALALRVEGRSSVEIAAELGVSRVTAWRLVSEALAARREEIADRTEELRAIEHERIEEYIGQLRPRALAGDMAAHRALLRWHERLARLLDLDLRREEREEDVTFNVIFATPAERSSPGGAETIDGEIVEPLGLTAGEDG